MRYLVVISMIIRGELFELEYPLSSYRRTYINDAHYPGNAHSILLWEIVKFSTHETAIQYANNISEKWKNALKFDPSIRNGYLKTGHLLLHSIDEDRVIWSEFEERPDYLFDGIQSSNFQYQEYGLFHSEE